MAFKTVTTISVGKSKPLPLSPPMSAFSAHQITTEKVDLGDNLGGSLAPWEKAGSSKTSLSSVEAWWQSAQESGLPAPKHVRKVESRKKLVRKGTTQ